MIIWRGWGALIFVIVFGCSLAANFICNAIVGAPYYDEHKWPFALSLVASAVICWVWGVIAAKKPDRVVIDKATGQEMVLKASRPALFFIPLQYWGPILLVIAIGVFVMEFIK
jgi:uncharacterized membrane protein